MLCLKHYVHSCCVLLKEVIVYIEAAQRCSYGNITNAGKIQTNSLFDHCSRAEGGH